MHTVALFGGHDPHGLTARLAQHLLNTIPGTSEFIDLNTRFLHPDRPGEPNLNLDALEANWRMPMYGY